MLGQTKGKVLGAAILLIIIAGGVFILTQGPLKQKTPPPKTAEEKAQLLIRKDSYQLGNPDAPVSIFEFVDFQCEACNYVYPITKKILEEYEGKVNLTVRYWPLDQHKNALASAYAAEAAGERGKYWEMYDKLMTSLSEWGESDRPWDIFVGYAKDLDLDGFPTDFETAVGKFSTKVERDKQDALALKAKGVPNFFINGVDYGYIQTYDEFKEKVEIELVACDRTTITEDDIANGRLLSCRER